MTVAACITASAVVAIVLAAVSIAAVIVARVFHRQTRRAADEILRRSYRAAASPPRDDAVERLRRRW